MWRNIATQPYRICVTDSSLSGRLSQVGLFVNPNLGKYYFTWELPPCSPVVLILATPSFFWQTGPLWVRLSLWVHLSSPNVSSDLHLASPRSLSWQFLWRCPDLVQAIRTGVRSQFGQSIGRFVISNAQVTPYPYKLSYVIWGCMKNLWQSLTSLRWSRGCQEC
jgi:hypothetical protein